VFLTWTYVTSFIFLFGAYLNVVYVQSKNVTKIPLVEKVEP